MLSQGPGPAAASHHYTIPFTNFFRPILKLAPPAFVSSLEAFRAMARKRLLRARTWGSSQGEQHPRGSVGACHPTVCLPAGQVPRMLLRFLSPTAALGEHRDQSHYLVQCDSKNAE